MTLWTAATLTKHPRKEMRNHLLQFRMHEAVQMYHDVTYDYQVNKNPPAQDVMTTDVNLQSSTSMHTEITISMPQPPPASVQSLN